MVTRPSDGCASCAGVVHSLRLLGAPGGSPARPDVELLLPMSNDLIEAIKNGDAEGVAALLDADRSLLGASANNVSAILLAVYYQRPEIASLFIERGAELTFAEACAVGDVNRAFELLDRDPSLLERRTADGFPP